MTRHAHLKQLIRARMTRTGERYATARRHILARRDESATSVSDGHAQGAQRRDANGGMGEPGSPIFTLEPSVPSHVPGNVPATTALRILLDHAGVRAPHTGQPFSEAMLFGIAGGIGIGVFSFYYEHEDIATFFVGGRHHWYDDRRYLLDALGRLSVTPIVQETGGAKAADTQLRTALERGPCIAWVDSTLLPHRATPGSLAGSGYHVIIVYQVDDAAGTALIGDLADDPLSIPLDALAQARSRIKKDRHRILSLGDADALPSLDRLVHAGLQACYDGLLNPALPGSTANARLQALQTWAERLEGSSAKERWERVYRPGANFFRGLCAIYDYVEHYGTGGGLCRPIFADFLAEAADALGQRALAELGSAYAALGRDWSALADAALPDDVALMAEAKALLAHKAELLHAGGPIEEARATWARLAELEQQAGEAFPLAEADCRELRLRLKARVTALYEAEVAAHEAMGRAAQ